MVPDIQGSGDNLIPREEQEPLPSYQAARCGSGGFQYQREVVPRVIIDSDHVARGTIPLTTRPLTSVPMGPWPKQRAEFRSNVKGWKRSYFISSSTGK